MSLTPNENLSHVSVSVRLFGLFILRPQIETRLSFLAFGIKETFDV